MQGTILLNHSENVKAIEEEEKTRFLRSILDQMGVPIQDFWADDNVQLSIEQRIKLRGVLGTFGIQVIDDREGRLQVYVDKQVVASWDKCTYKLKRDLSELDPRKQLYLEMTINCHSLFEETEQQEETTRIE